MSQTLISTKNKYSKVIKEFYKFQTKNKPLGLIKLTDTSMIDALLDGLEVLLCDFVIEIEQEYENRKNIIFTKNIPSDMLVGFDFVVGDSETSKVGEYVKLWITPILSSHHHLSSLIRDFDPLQNEGNGYIYLAGNYWSIFIQLVRYLENYKFPYDNKNLVLNVLKI